MIRVNKQLGPVDNSSFENRRPATYSRDPEILLHAKANCTALIHDGSRGQAAGRRDMNCQQTLGFLASLFVILITSCSSNKTALLPEQTSSSTPQTQLEANSTTLTQENTRSNNTTIPSSFDLSGAIAAKNHKKGWTATINWKQNGPNQYQIRLLGPVGTQAVMIEKKHGMTTYREGAKEVTSSNDHDLLQKQTGIHLPINNLYYWIRGIPAPGPVQSSAYNPDHTLHSLRQAGYTIEYTQYITVGKVTLPSKIRLQGQELTIKLIVKNWQLG